MHETQIRFCLKIKDKFPNHFKNCNILDVGSLGINGDNRYLFTNCKYTGIDVIKGPNVDVVCVAHLFNPNVKFDTIISTNALEHDIFYVQTLNHLTSLLRSGGLLLIQSYIGPRHGTLDITPFDSGTTRVKSEDHPHIDKRILKLWPNYYKSIGLDEFSNIIDFTQFEEFKVDKQPNHGIYDLTFYGIKK